jgi:hypothetical protein
VDATPSSRENPATLFGLCGDAGDEASPAPSATGTSQLRTPAFHFSTASFRLSVHATNFPCPATAPESSPKIWQAFILRAMPTTLVEIFRDSAATPFNWSGPATDTAAFYRMLPTS